MTSPLWPDGGPYAAFDDDDCGAILFIYIAIWDVFKDQVLYCVIHLCLK